VSSDTFQKCRTPKHKSAFNVCTLSSPSGAAVLLDTASVDGKDSGGWEAVARLPLALGVWAALEDPAAAAARGLLENRSRGGGTGSETGDEAAGSLLMSRTSMGPLTLFRWI